MIGAIRQAYLLALVFRHVTRRCPLCGSRRCCDFLMQPDGKTDMTSTIQHHMDYRRCVKLRRGEYRITRTLQIPGTLTGQHGPLQTKVRWPDAD